MSAKSAEGEAAIAAEEAEAVGQAPVGAACSLEAAGAEVGRTKE
jgi:hypothetical protein